MQDEGIEIHAVEWAYADQPVLTDINLSIRAGRCTVLLGPNGAGKSTLVSLLCGLIVAGNGRIEVRGYDMATQTRKALALMGLVFQQPTLDLDLTVWQNMLYFTAIRGISGKPARDRIEKCLQRLGLGDRRHDKARALNGGHRRRLEIARALVHAPEVLILDEPTTGLDVPSRAALVEHIHALCVEEGLTVLWATHLVDEVWPDDDLVVLHNGRVEAAGPIRRVLSEIGADTVLQAFNQLTSTASSGLQQEQLP